LQRLNGVACLNGIRLLWYFFCTIIFNDFVKFCIINAILAAQLLKPLIMTTKRLLLKISFLLLCVTFTQLAFSQTKVVTGTIIDDKGVPVQGATVTVKGSSKGGTTTNANGIFSLTVPGNANTLVVSSVGFNKQEIDITDKAAVSVTLATSSTSLNEVVVTGYGTARKKDLTGAVSQIASKDFTTGNLANPAQLIAGKVPGVVVTQPGGDPNGLFTIRLRGQTSISGGQTPLIVVDGVPLDDPATFSDIPASDIASIDVLKDASAAAIYGSRGANGVMMVNTKKGVAGRTTVEYNGSVSVDNVAKLYDMANAPQWKQGYTQLLTSQGATPGAIDTAITGYDHGGNTDWQKALLQTGFSTNQNVSITGGSNGFSYRGTVNYIDQQGIVINSGRKQLGLRFTAQQKALNDKLVLQFGILNTNTTRKLTDYNIFYEAYSSPPVYPVKNPDGTYFAYSDFALQNPVQQQSEETQNVTENFTIINAAADYEIIPGLKLGVLGSSSQFNSQFEYFEPVFEGVGNSNVGSTATGNIDSKKGNAHVNYAKSWGKSNFTFTGVYEYNVFENNQNGAVASNLLLNSIGAWNLQSAPQQFQHTYSERDEAMLISYIGRATYNWDQKYFLTASIRDDGSSKFGANNAWGLFPSAAAAWRISSEPFLKNVSWLNELKINAGWGKTGNQDGIGPYSKLELYSNVGSYYNASSGLWLTEYGPSQNANPNLQWEVRTGRNIGFDFGLFQNHLSGGFNYFNDITTKLLYTYNIPFPSPGAVVDNSLANVGAMTNKGVEFNLNYQVIQTRDFSFTLGGQISSVQTRITSLAGTYSNGVSTYSLSTDAVPEGSAEGRGLSTAPITYLKVGYTPYVFYMPHYIGLNSKGQEMYDSAKGGTTTNVLNASNYYTDPAPKFNYGINLGFTYKAWGLNTFLRGIAGAKIFDNTRMVLDNINRFGGNNGTVEALTNGITNGPQASDHWLENASFLRMDNLNLSYTFKPTGQFQNIRLYIAMNNVFVITKYRGLDPEVRVAASPTNALSNALGSAGVANSYSQGGSTGNQQYIDAAYSGDGYYPKTHSYTLGVNITFR
jgi:TonB-linked SusC/RagA family outer membrane protein